MIPLTEEEMDQVESIWVIDPITAAINQLSLEEFIKLMVELEKQNERPISGD